MSKFSFQKILDEIQENLANLPISDSIRKKIIEGLLKLKKQKLNLLIVGATGAGKSSTINALFGLDHEVKHEEVAKEGHDPNPETMEINDYKLNNLILWDSPGLGDSEQNDKIHAEKIKELLKREDKDGKGLIDLVLVIIDSSVRDLGTTYTLINDVIFPNFPHEDRIIVGLNKCDKAISRTPKFNKDPFNFEENKPEPHLLSYLEEKLIPAVKSRIYDGTGADIEPVYYSAGFNYNISKLLYLIVRSTPDKKRMAVATNMKRRYLSL
jgi:predicted GTPase